MRMRVRQIKMRCGAAVSAVNKYLRLSGNRVLNLRESTSHLKLW